MSRSLLVSPAGVGLTDIVRRLNQHPHSAAEKVTGDEQTEPVRGSDSTELRGVPSIEVFYVEEELLREVKWESGRYPFHNRHDMRDLLRGVTRRELMGRWQKALETCIKSADASKAANTAIAFHPSLFASRRSEQYSTVGWAIAADKLTGIDRVVLLIDDVFDMWERLGAEDHGIFHHSEWMRRRLEAQDLDEFIDVSGKSVAAKPGLEHTFDRLVVDSAHAILGRLLGWRHIDMVESESLASAVNAPLTTLGVKHPFAALEKLLSEPSTTTAYLSHPISRPRRTRNAGSPWPPVVRESNELSSRFADVDVVLVCPTAIDEFRLAQPAAPQDVFSRRYALAERWPLLVPFEDAINTTERPSDRLTHVPITSKNPGLPVGAVARSIETEIFAEVPFRDHYLVTHTDSFFVFRPLFQAGDFSDGVRAEIVHWGELAKFEPNRRALFVHSRSDIQEVTKTVERAVTAERLRNNMRQFLKAEGLADADADKLLENAHIKSAMLDAESPSAAATTELTTRALRHAGAVAFFGALTALQENWMGDARVGVAIQPDSAPSHSELSSYAGFLTGGHSTLTNDNYLDQIEHSIGSTLAEWTQRRVATPSRPTSRSRGGS